MTAGHALVCSRGGAARVSKRCRLDSEESMTCWAVDTLDEAGT
ncbi:hypothetical protein SAMN04489726_0678 [Allokutzneria albata]|uniref:Uncharacterized protein n=1 Tax=Allokutzneria albata TaxID=211114 RepID=A0A1G9RTQ5_ALLAB|nr:hypothetical protein SAMN04489726_0678 [Allokutzneria albata]